MDASAAEAIVEYRKTQVFLQVSDLFQVPGLKEEMLSGVSDWLTVKSSAVAIEARGTYRNNTCAVLAIARKNDFGGSELLYWQTR